jgi:dTDP-glucose 4,6-dehydratase
LITGGCGFLGHHIVEHLLRNTDSEIVVLDKLTYASSGFDRLRDIAAFDDKRVKILGCDLSQPIPEGIDHEIGHINFVIHAAAETHVDNSIVDPMPFLKSNVFGTHHLLWWLRMRPQRPTRIFLISTDEVYGPAEFGDDVEGFNEHAAFRPANPYAAAKAGGEAIGMAYANTYRLPITIVNTMNLIGERQHHEKFVPMVIRRALKGELVKIHADATRTISGTRFYIHCRNFADALLYMIDRELLGGVSDLPLKIHVAGEKEISNLDLALMIGGFVGKTVNYELVDFHSSRPGHDLRYAMSAKLIKTLGWKQPKNIEESLKKTVEWYLANPKWLGL